jgi:hypothetical protein
MMTKVMHQTMIDQAKVFANTVHNSLIEALKKEQKEDTWGMYIFNQTELLQCSNKTNRSLHRLMIQLKSYTVSTGCSWFFIGLLADSESKW